MGRKSRKRTHKQFAEEVEQNEYDHDNEESFNGFNSSYVGNEDGYGELVPASKPPGAEHEDVRCYEKAEEVPEDIQNYFRQRHRIFSLYNHGIWMTNTAWYGVTQEAVANKIATHISESIKDPQRQVILDVMAGAGGNTLAFARLPQDRFSRIYAFEKDPATLECLKHNAQIYGLTNRISFLDGDCFSLLEKTPNLQMLAKQFGIIFCSPPWGGPTYRSSEVFNLALMKPYSIQQLYTELRKYSDHIVLYLPRSSDLRQIAELIEDEEVESGGKKGAPPKKKVNVVHYCTEGSSRALCVYLGPFQLSDVL